MEQSDTIKTIETLTEREASVLAQLVIGRSYQAIASSLFRGHWRARQVAYGLFKKFGVTSREALTEKAATSGLIYFDHLGDKHCVRMRLVEKLLVSQNQASGVA